MCLVIAQRWPECGVVHYCLVQACQEHAICVIYTNEVGRDEISHLHIKREETLRDCCPHYAADRFGTSYKGDFYDYWKLGYHAGKEWGRNPCVVRDAGGANAVRAKLGHARFLVAPAVDEGGGGGGGLPPRDLDERDLPSSRGKGKGRRRSVDSDDSFDSQSDYSDDSFDGGYAGGYDDEYNDEYSIRRHGGGFTTGFSSRGDSRRRQSYIREPRTPRKSESSRPSTSKRGGPSVRAAIAGVLGSVANNINERSQRNVERSAEQRARAARQREEERARVAAQHQPSFSTRTASSSARPAQPAAPPARAQPAKPARAKTSRAPVYQDPRMLPVREPARPSHASPAQPAKSTAAPARPAKAPTSLASSRSSQVSAAPQQAQRPEPIRTPASTATGHYPRPSSMVPEVEEPADSPTYPATPSRRVIEAAPVPRQQASSRTQIEAVPERNLLEYTRADPGRASSDGHEVPGARLLEGAPGGSRMIEAAPVQAGGAGAPEMPPRRAIEAPAVGMGEDPFLAQLRRQGEDPFLAQLRRQGESAVAERVRARERMRARVARR